MSEVHKVDEIVNDKLLTFNFPEEWEEMEILPVNDVHIGDVKTDIRLFRAFLKYVQEKPNRYVMLIGDVINNATKSSVSNVYREVMPPQEQKKFLIQEFSQ